MIQRDVGRLFVTTKLVRPFITSSSRCPEAIASQITTITSSRRPLATSISRSASSHRTYFQRDSTPFRISQVPRHQTNDQVQSQRLSHTNDFHEQRSWTMRRPINWYFLGGLVLAFPSGLLTGMYLLTSGYVPGWNAGSNRDLVDSYLAADEAARSCDGYILGLNLASIMTHRLLYDLMSPSKKTRFVQDNDALRNGDPLELETGTILRMGTSAVLVRVVDENDKNVALIFAFEDSLVEQFEPENWQPDRTPVRWMDDLSRDYHDCGQNAYYDIPLVIYNADYMGVYRGAVDGFIWTKLDSRSFPPGFPLRQLRELPSV